MDIYIRITDENGKELRGVNIHQDGSDSEAADNIADNLMKLYGDAASHYITNPIVDSSEYKEAFIEWASDHYQQFKAWPGTFIYSIDGSKLDDPIDIEFSEIDVMTAIDILIDTGELML